MPMRGNISLERKLPSEKKKLPILISELGASKIQRQVSFSERDPNRQHERKISKCSTVRPKVYRVE